MTVLVIGGTGMVGPGVVAALRARGHRVVVAHRGRTTADLGPDVEIVRCDRADSLRLRGVLDACRADGVVDLACYAADDARSLCDAVDERHRCAFVSTVQVLGGPHDGPLCEDDAPTPLSDYARAKHAAELVIQHQALTRGLRVTTVRLGPCFREGCALDGQLFEDPSWLRRLDAGQPLAVADGGSALWNLMHADDAGRAIVDLLESDRAAGETVLVGSAHVRSWLQFYGMIASHLALPLECVAVDGRWLRRHVSNPDFLDETSLWDQVYDLSRLRRLAPGFRETVDIDGALVRTAAALLAHGRPGDEALAREEGRLIDEWRGGAARGAALR